MDITYLTKVVLLLILLVILLILIVWFVYYLAEKLHCFEVQHQGSEEVERRVKMPSLRRYLEKLHTSTNEELGNSPKSLSTDPRREGLVRSSFGFDLKSLESGKVEEKTDSSIWSKSLIPNGVSKIV